MKTTRIFVVLISTALLLILFSTSAFAEINNWCDTDPVGNSKCTSNVNKPTWTNPGYSWRAFLDVGLGNRMCMQYSTDGGTNWTQTTCDFVGQTAAKEDCIGAGTCGTGRNDHWECTIGSNILSTSDIKFQFYKDPNTCDGDFTGTTEWSSQPTFSTGPTAITLADLSATGAMASSLPLVATAGASALAVLSAGFVAWRRRK